MNNIVKGIYFSLMVVCAVLYALKENIGFFMIMTFCGLCILIDDNIQAKKQREELVGKLEELVDKATPNKVTMQEFGKYIINYDGQCKCGEFLTRSDKYCHDCGQSLDWENHE